MILLLGATGYYGRAFASELQRQGHSFIPLTRRAFDFTRFEFLFDYLGKIKPDFLINAANFCGEPNEIGCETQRDQAMEANALLPQVIARVCLLTKTPWGHVSSGSIYSGCKVIEDQKIRVEKDLGDPEIQRLFERSPERFRGFDEVDEPNFSFRSPPCSFYSGTKVLGEEAAVEIGQNYVWRMRLPFNERDHPCNLLCQPASAMDESINSLSHLEDCVKACLDLWQIGAPYGIYNVTNPGAVTTRKIQEAQQRCGKSAAERPRFFQPKTLRSNCVLDVAKLLRTGVKLRSVNEAMADSLDKMTRSLPSLKISHYRTPVESL